MRLSSQELCLWRCASLRAPKVEAPCLRALNYSDCFELSDAAVERACTQCPALQKLQLAGCNALRGGWRASSLGGEEMSSLDLSDVRTLDDDVLSGAVARCPRLTRLDCSGCSTLHSPVIGGAHLRALLLSRCDALSDEAVTMACARSPGLSSLVLSLCPSLCMPRCFSPELIEANLSGCSSLLDEAVELLAAELLAVRLDDEKRYDLAGGTLAPIAARNLCVSISASVVQLPCMWPHA